MGVGSEGEEGESGAAATACFRCGDSFSGVRGAAPDAAGVAGFVLEPCPDAATRHRDRSGCSLGVAHAGGKSW
jgi:hypothetical protein